MHTLEDRIKKFAKCKGATLVGLAPIERLSSAPTGHRPKDLLPRAKSIVSLGLRINKSSILQLPKTMKEYKLSYEMANLKLDNLACQTACFLEEKRYEALAVPASKPFDAEGLFGDISHKHVAVAAGLGRFGLNNLVLTPEYGPYVRFTTIITSARLDPDELLNRDLCLGEKCLKCVKACPAKALEKHHYDPSNGWWMNKQKCHEYIHRVSGGDICGLCIKACTISR